MTGAGAIVVYDPGQCKFLFHRSSSNGCRLKLGWCDIFCHPTPQLEDRFRKSRAQQTRYSKLYSYGRKLPYLCSCRSLQPGATLLRLASILLVGCFVERHGLSVTGNFVCIERFIGIASSHPESERICKMEGRGRRRVNRSRGTSEHYPCTALC
jgi:hypothetical protein